MTYEELCSFEVLYKAYLEARKGKRSKSKTIEYEAQALACTEKLSRKLAVCNVRQPDGSIRQQIRYVPSKFEVFAVYEPKRRMVHAPAFVDKVVLHALVDNILYDALTKSFSGDHAVGLNENKEVTMANVKLGTKAVGSIVKIKVNGASKDFIVVQQGNPNTGTYDSSCNGTWLLMKDIYTTSTFGNNNSYKDSSIHTYLNGTFYNLIDSDIRNAIKQVKIPYQNGTGSGGSLATGSNGLSTKVFLLSGYEVGWTTSDNGYFPKDGVRLAYFGNSSGGSSKRVAYNGSSAAVWWLRSPYTYDGSNVWYVGTDGSGNNYWYRYSCGVRPAFILPSTLVVSDDGTVSVNTAPTVSTDGAALGRKNATFAWKYTVRDADGDTLTVTEKLDGKTTKTRTGVASGATLTFEQTASAAGFQKILNGNHTIQITASDGKESTSLSATFTKSVTSATVTLTTPLAVDGDITVAVLQVTGSIPDDATFKVEATNNANDPSPVWQDATVEVKKGVNIVFTNSEATNGAAFNFRVSVSRGASGTGGYIEAVSGAFQ